MIRSFTEGATSRCVTLAGMSEDITSLYRLRTIADEFPEDIAAIDRLRNSDPRFEEICSDFEALSRDLQRLSPSADPSTRRLVVDIHETLDGLADEIRVALQSYEKTSLSSADSHVYLKGKGK